MSSPTYADRIRAAHDAAAELEKKLKDLMTHHPESVLEMEQRKEQLRTAFETLAAAGMP